MWEYAKPSLQRNGEKETNTGNTPKIHCFDQRLLLSLDEQINLLRPALCKLDDVGQHQSALSIISTATRSRRGCQLSSTHSSITHSGLCGTFSAKVCLRLGAHTWVSHSKVAHSLENFWSSFQSAFGLLLKEEEAPLYEGCCF
ncbi:hypothetical protein MHYP_G00185640 [Metynnis hypsauchen]